MSRRKAAAAPPNLAAKALQSRLYRQRKVRNAKLYSRKVKHRKGERDAHSAPLFAARPAA